MDIEILRLEMIDKTILMSMVLMMISIECYSMLDSQSILTTLFDCFSFCHIGTPEKDNWNEKITLFEKLFNKLIYHLRAHGKWLLMC